MTTHGRWVSFCCVVAMTPVSAHGGSAQFAMPTHGLDLKQVQLVVVAAPELRDRLYGHAMAQFAKAGLSLPSPDQPHAPFAATLKLILDPQPLHETCPGKVLYGPSLALIEPVVLPRNSVVWRDITWSTSSEPRVHEPLSAVQLEEDLEKLIDQFVTSYKHANPGWQSRETERFPDPAPSLVLDSAGARGDAGLKNLPVNMLELSVMAGRWTIPLTTRAVHQLTKAGLPISRNRHGSGAVTLSVELIQRSIGDHCPGKVLYESGLYVVEEVQVQRNPRIPIWTDTWARESIRIVAPVSLQQLESDQDALLRQFIHSLQAK